MRESAVVREEVTGQRDSGGNCPREQAQMRGKNFESEGGITEKTGRRTRLGTQGRVADATTSANTRLIGYLIHFLGAWPLVVVWLLRGSRDRVTGSSSQSWSCRALLTALGKDDRVE